MNMILITLFSVTLLGGLCLMSYVLRHKNTPKGLALIHGTAGGISLLVLMVGSFFNKSLLYALGLFIFAVLSGIALFASDIGGKRDIKKRAFIHGFIAVSGFVSLLVFLFH